VQVGKPGKGNKDDFVTKGIGKSFRKNSSGMKAGKEEK